MKRMLFITARFPWPLSSGQQIATFQDLRYLAQNTNTDIDVVSLIDNSETQKTTQYIKELQEVIPNINVHLPIPHPIYSNRHLTSKAFAFLRGLFKRTPFIVSKLYNKRLVNTVINLLETQEFNVIYFDQLGVTYLLDLIPQALRNRSNIIYRPHDIIAETLYLYAKHHKYKPYSIIILIDFLNCKLYEQRIWREVDHIFPITKRLCELINTYDTRIASKVYEFPVMIEPSVTIMKPHENGNNILYVGSIHYPPNYDGIQWFINQCWPLIRQRVPNAHIDIVGRGGENIHNITEGINIHGYVESIDEYYQRAALLIVPLFSGSGVRLKILDAMSRGLPIVSTRTGYLGLELIEGEHLLVADDAEGFAQHVCHLLNNPHERQRLACNGRKFVMNHHNFYSIQHPILQLINNS